MRPSSLSKNILFKLCLWGGATLTIAVGLIIATNNEYPLCFKVSCFSNLLVIYEIPIKIASTGIALAAFVALIHRSEQTNYQIDITNRQNIFKNFMDHRAELFKVLDTLSEDYGISFKHRNDLYFKLFPKNNFQNVEFVSSATDNKDSRIISIISTYNDFIEDYNSLIRKFEIEQPVPYKDLAEWITRFMLLSASICVYPEKTKKVHENWQGYISPMIIEGIPEDLDGFIFSIENVLLELSEFCFPNVDIEILIDGRDHSEVINEVINDFCSGET